jgi:hypothetical protein
LRWQWELSHYIKRVTDTFCYAMLKIG